MKLLQINFQERTVKLKPLQRNQALSQIITPHYLP